MTDLTWLYLTCIAFAARGVSHRPMLAVSALCGLWLLSLPQLRSWVVLFFCAQFDSTVLLALAVGAGLRQDDIVPCFFFFCGGICIIDMRFERHESNSVQRVFRRARRFRDV